MRNVTTPIKAARKRAGLTQRQMAELFGIPLRTVENWDAGGAKTKKWAEKLLIEKLDKIAEEKGLLEKV